MDKSNSITEGFAIGNRMNIDSRASTRDGRDTDTSTNRSEKPSPYVSGKYRPSSRLNKTGLNTGDIEKKSLVNDMQSFVFNEDMKRIRIAESIILRAESKFGTFSRDPDGRLAPLLQALTKKAAVELRKDDHRPITEPSDTTFNYAPHALRGGVGLAATAWSPAIQTAAQLEDSKDKIVSKFLKEHDDSVNPKYRGQKSGGALRAADTRGSFSRPRKPIKASISSRVDFNRYRNIQSLGERLEQINQLKNEVNALKQQQSNEILVTQSSLSNKFGAGGLAGPFEPKALYLDTKSFPEGYLSSRQPDASSLKKLDFTKGY
jgi:hypothetical protein